MVESSKILTVSYGTFSCTLEGFDDSFGTMKAIAEYFRDLAADDRYFGAEPPAPDVAMLAKIAEREITRRVDAHATDGGIVLRASEALAPAMPPQMAPPNAVQMAAAAVAPQVAPALQTGPTAKDHTLDDFQTALSDATADDMEPVAGSEAEDHVSSPLVASDQATPHGLTFDDMAQDETAELPAHPDAESVAAKLQRIRAVVGKVPTKSEDAEFAEDLGTVKMPDVTDVVEPEIANVSVPDIVVADVADDMQADDSPIAPLADVDDIDVATQGIDMSGLDFGNQDGEATIEPPLEELPKIADKIEAIADDMASPMQKDDAILDDLAARIGKATDDATPETSQAQDKPIIRAQILRIRKPEVAKVAVKAPIADADSFAFVAEEVIANTNDYDDADYDPEEDLPNVAALDGVEDLEGFETPVNTTLSEDEEADLMEELAEVERDFAPVQEDAVAPTQKPRTTLPETDDATMSHILDQTDQQLSEPEGSRRRDAIAQLKAAVAATEAARQLGDKGRDKDEVEGAFRDDLKEVVSPTHKTAARPTRVKPTEARTERPRPAPLKLVASQRVDTAAPSESSTPVQPRRIASAAEPINPDAVSSFAEFAEEMGATALPDLLEAAAAYTSFVEGVEDFSRPQIMKKVQLSTETEFSREDGLRSFGTLLRQGRISKVRNGRFQVSEASRFNPESKAG